MSVTNTYRCQQPTNYYAIKFHSFTAAAAVLVHSPCTTPLQVATASRTRRRALWDTIQTAPLGTKWTRWIVVFTEWHFLTARSFITSINSKALITSCSCVYADTCVWFPGEKEQNCMDKHTRGTMKVFYQPILSRQTKHSTRDTCILFSYPAIS